MEALRILLWNDEPETLRSWLDTAKADGFPGCIGSDSQDADAVVRRFLETQPDVVVLDIMVKKKRAPLGLTIAKKMREVDPLVPLIAITAYPNEVYAVEGDLNQLGFCGIYHNTVVQKNMFREVAVRYALGHWNAMLSEHVLIRATLVAMEQRLGKILDGEDLGAMVHTLRRLPYAPSIESWHRELCEDIAVALERRGHSDLAKAYREIVAVFEQADPFFMASRLGRRHLSHNIQVFLMGLIILLSDNELWQYACDSFKDISPTSDADAIPISVLLLWACIGTTHDAAYLSQNLSIVTSRLATIASRFRVAFDPMPSEQTGWKWPADHHATVGGTLWRSSLTSPGPDADMAEMIASTKRFFGELAFTLSGLVSYTSAAGNATVKEALPWPRKVKRSNNGCMGRRSCPRS